MRLSLQILGTIGKPSDEYGYSFTTSDEIIESINKSKDIESIDLYIDSIGGSVSEGNKMIRAIEGVGVPVDVYLERVAASMGSYIAAYFKNRGSNIYMSPDLELMYHSARSTVGGTAKELFKMAEDAESVDEMFANEYAKAFGMDKEVIISNMKSDYWMNAKELEELNFGMLYEGNSQLAACVDNEDIYNRLNPKQHKMADYKSIAAVLDLQTEASEEAILKNVKAIKTDLEAKISELSALKAEKDTMKAKLETAENEVNELKTKTAKSEATVLVGKFEAEFGKKLADKEEVLGRAVRYAMKAVSEEDEVAKEDATEALKSFIKAHGAPVESTQTSKRQGDNLDGLEAIENIEAKAKEEGISFSAAYKKYGV